MKDYIGNTISEGDIVVYAKTGSYGSFQGTFQVTGFTNTLVRLSGRMGIKDYGKAAPHSLIVVTELLDALERHG